MNDNIDNGGRGSLRGFYSYKNTFNKDSVWLDIPKHVIFVDNSDPYTQDLEPALTESEAALLAANSQSARWDNPQIAPTEREETQGVEALSTLAAGAHDRLPYPALVVDQPSVSTPGSVTTPFSSISTTMPASHPHRIPRSISAQISPPISIHSDNGNNTNIHFLLNPSQSLSPPIDPTIQRTPDSAGSPLPLKPIENNLEGRVETDYEITFLLRHFSEVPGPWMDLYDFGTYFSSQVPIKALRNPLLKYAACAQAAKQLGHVHVSRSVGVRLSRAFSGVQKDSTNIDWCWKGAKYYEKAIQLLMKELQPNGGNRDMTAQGKVDGMSDDADAQRARSYTVYRLSHGVRSDEILAATAILSVYELLDATGPAWNRHLSGVKSLLDLAEVGMRPLQRLPPGDLSLQLTRPSLSKARKATFWNFARQDYLSAFINGSRTRLHTEDLALWTEAGLKIDSLGFVRPNNASAGGHPGEGIMQEDSISNALVWIISKIINFISPNKSAHVGPPGAVNSSPMGLPQQVSLERWYRLEAELDVWYKGLPETFHPCARIGIPETASQSDKTDDAPSLSEIWYSIPMCSSAMQHYHMGRILLHIHKPPQPSGATNPITSRYNSTDIQFHSREIVGIAMACPAGSVRINSLQPLFVSGQCLTDPSERRMVLRLLQDIEKDLGWATEYRAQQLRREWGWDKDTDVTGVS
ncbi:uncharacterized protein DSM5745_04078 [Aspergillus mulundensis]|uniref:Putative Zn(II)2Cys6 transcription factor n=1 Tax=Aspergillus mulundensis TaxID=1810919 RepID=A0A3D8SBL7_9EURO|nr:putative Zn(II)2Cys6 transcription factor [Aspergillus mulundensis]RDW83752.1 putative Zn(II)2Cys6 transcription factor [Aspergillus mulundensis]